MGELDTGDLLLTESARVALQTFVDRPSHAILVTGSHGSGLTTLAERITGALLGSTDIRQERYVRLLASEQGAIPIERVRELQGFLALVVPGKAAVRRVVIIDGADTMSLEAQNALLKTLEEPPADTVLVLTSAEPERLLATIRSRVAFLHIGLPERAQVTAYFAEQGYEDTAITRAYMLAEGAPGRMRNILSGEAGIDTDTVRTILAGSSYERLLQVEPLAKDKLAAGVFAATLVRVASATLERAAVQNPASLARWQRVLAAGMTAQVALAQNGNTKLVLTDLMLAL